MRRVSEEKKMTLEDPKADKPKASEKMPTKFELSWSQFDDKHNIVDKNKTFSSLEKFQEFKDELELDPNFLQIHHETMPVHMEQLPASKSEKMEKVKIKENKLRNLIKLMIIKEMNTNRKEFWRLPKNVIGNDLFQIQKSIKSIYTNLSAGNDLDMGQLENIINALNSVKDQAQLFKNSEAIKGTEYE